jgi:hypothetical protein
MILPTATRRLRQISSIFIAPSGEDGRSQTSRMAQLARRNRRLKHLRTLLPDRYHRRQSELGTSRHRQVIGAAGRARCRRPCSAPTKRTASFRYLTCNHATSEMGLGTQRRCDGVECAFHQVSFLFCENSRASSVAIDLENYSRGPWIF